MLTSSRGFTSEEKDYFTQNAEKAYRSFVEKAAYSRNKTFNDMHEVSK